MFKVNLKKNYKNENVQSVLVPKNAYSLEEAIDYVKKHFQFKKLDVFQRPNYFSFRQFNPRPNAKYFTKKLDNGILLVIDITK